MIDYLNCNMNNVAVHKVGNVTNEEDLILSKSVLNISETRLKDLLAKYFFHSFPTNEFFNFTFSNDDFHLNPLYNFASNIFEDANSFHLNSINIAKHLYEVSTHPKIKSGDLFIAKFSKLEIGEDQFEAIGIFKSENRQAFLKLDNDNFILECEDGINVDKLDKGCLIFNTDKSDGYKICIVDKSNKSSEAQYWKHVFLQLKNCSDDYHKTKEFMNITKNFVTNQVSEDFDVNKADKIDLLNRSVNYFKTHESFDKDEFETDVFNDKSLIESFRNFDNNYREENNIEVNQNFDISNQAVKKQAKAFKSVLKLDKNFHIYIHGDKKLIEQGVEADGRKYYKVYYQEEN